MDEYLRRLVCPKCKIQLEVRSNDLLCRGCGEVYKIIDDVPAFVENFPYWGEISHDDLTELLSILIKKGFRQSAFYLATKHPQIAHYFLSDGRIDWLFHVLPSGPRLSCLDVGSGLGTIAFLLSRFYNEVWSLEPVHLRIRYQKVRAQQEKITSLHFAQSTVNMLPFPDNYFDLVTFNGILEWVGSLNPSDPQRAQLSALKEALRVLKPSGLLYIGIENRLGEQYFFGAHDHSGLPFTSLMPRQIANFATRILGKIKEMPETQHRYFTYTYSAFGYEKLLRTAGFNGIEIYWTDSYNFPKFSGKIFGSSFKLYLERMSTDQNMKNNWLIRGGLMIPKCFLQAISIFSPCFLIFGWKGLQLPSLKKSIGDFTKCNDLLLMGGYRKVQFVSDHEYIARFSRFGRNAMIENEETELISMDGTWASCTNKTFDGHNLTLEQYIDGQYPEILNPAHNRNVLDWLIKFQKSSKSIFSRTLFDASIMGLRRYVNKALLLRQKDREFVNYCLQKFGEEMMAVGGNSCSEHGDFCYSNILQSGGKLFVLDWEFFKKSGNPFFDPCFYMLTGASMNGYQTFISNFTANGDYSKLLKQNVRHFLGVNSFPPDMFLYAFPYTIVRIIRRHDPRYEHFSTNFIVFSQLLSLWIKHFERIAAFIA